MAGITAFGAYIPKLRLSRKAAVDANGWFNAALRSLGKGERAMCNWDEDALTMAVEAARDCLGGRDRDAVGHLTLASTTLPFKDRQNAAILAQALNLKDDIASIDMASSLRCGTSAMLAAFDTATARPGSATLVVAGEHRRARAASAQELQYGDAAAAVLVGSGDEIAELVGLHQVSVDFVDHYRGESGDFDYYWEERWARDEGVLKIIPAAVRDLLERTGTAPEAVDHFIVPVPVATARRIAGATGIAADALADNLAATLGDSGAAHPLVMLADCLHRAGPGETILLVGYGQGCDAVLLRTTDLLAAAAKPAGVPGALARRREETNYNRYLAFNGLIEQEKGIRAELDKQTAVSALYRNRDMVLGFVGGRCDACGTVQFPKTRACVNPNCGRFNTQAPHPMSDVKARVQSWTADGLTYSPDPPHHFGMIVFEEGGRLMMDFTDVDAGAVDVGMPVRMMFRVKDYDERRGFRRYFWKAAPATT
jgi:3-hydroxy-3-methylglutaryl CoA synthase